MPFPIQTTVRDPGFISVLLATRGRPQFLAALFDSLLRTVADPGRLDVWMYVDADDEPTIAYVRDVASKQFPFELHMVDGPALATGGEMYNVLRARNTSGTGIYMFCTDKVNFRTAGWDVLVRQTFDAVPDRVAFAFPRDSFNKGRFGAFGFLSAEWANATGRLMTEYFPFWFDDTWINSVALMTGRMYVLDMDVDIEFARTNRMQNLSFWQRFYSVLYYERDREVEALLGAIRARSGDDAYREAAVRGAQNASNNNLEVLDISPSLQASIVRSERDYAAALSRTSPREAADSMYRRSEDAALARLTDAVLHYGNAGKDRYLAAAVDTMMHSSRAADDLYARIEALLAASQAIAPTDPQVSAMFERFPNFPETYLLGADVCLDASQVEKAIELLRAGAEVFTGHPDFHKRLGVLYFQLGMPQEATQAFLQVRRLAPTDLDMLISLAHLAMDAAKPDEARLYLDEALATGTDEPDVAQAAARWQQLVGSR